MPAELTIVDYVVFTMVLMISLLIGLYYAWKSRKETSNKRFLVGDRNMSVVPTAISLAASLISSSFALAMPAEIFSHGIQYWFSQISAIFGILFGSLIFIPMLYSLRMPSIFEYFSKRYNSHGIRTVLSLSFNLLQILYNGIQIYGAALVISSVTPLSSTTSVLTVGLVSTFYTALGGVKAVVWADVLQAGIMIAGFLMVAIQGTINVGGMANIWNAAEEGHALNFFQWEYDDKYGSPRIWEISLGNIIIWGRLFATNQMAVQRYCTLPTLKKAYMAIFLGAVFTFIFMGVACYCGLILFANYWRCDPLKLGRIRSPDQLLPLFVLDFFNSAPGMSGLFISSVFSCALSTLSTSLNWMTIVVWEDFLKKWCKVSSRTEIIITKMIVFFFGLLAIGGGLLTQRLGTLLHAIIRVTSWVTGPGFGVFLQAALVPFSNEKGVIVGFISGAAVCLYINVYDLVYPPPRLRLHTYTDGCPASYNLSTPLSNVSFPFTLVNNTVPDIGIHQPAENISWILKISPFFIPFIGAAVCVVVGVITSLLTGGLKTIADPLYISPLIGGTANKLRKQKKTFFQPLTTSEAEDNKSLTTLGL